MNWRRIISFALVIVFGAIFIMQLGDIGDVLGVLRQGRPAWLVAGLALQLLWFLNQTALYQALYSLLELPIRIRQMLPIVLASNFVNFSTPTASMGAIPLFLDDAKQRGLDPGKVTLISLLRLVLNLAWFSIPLTFSLIVLSLNHTLRTHHLVAATLLLGSAAVMVGGIVLAGLYPDGFEKKLTWAADRLNRLGQRLWKRDLLSAEEAGQFACRFGDAARALWNGRRHLVRPWFHIMLFDGLELAVLYCMYMAFPNADHVLSPSRLIAGYSIGVLFSVVAITPQGLGVVEGTLVAAFTSLGLPMAQATVMMLAYRGLSFWLPMVAGVVALRWVRGIGRPPADVEEAEDAHAEDKAYVDGSAQLQPGRE